MPVVSANNRPIVCEQIVLPHTKTLICNVMLKDMIDIFLLHPYLVIYIPINRICQSNLGKYSSMESPLPPSLPHKFPKRTIYHSPTWENHENIHIRQLYYLCILAVTHPPRLLRSIYSTSKGALI